MTLSKYIMADIKLKTKVNFNFAGRRLINAVEILIKPNIKRSYKSSWQNKTTICEKWQLVTPKWASETN